MEELLIRKIKGGISSIKGGRKLPQESGVGSNLLKLKSLNLMMYEELLDEYKIVIQKHNEKI